MNEIEEKIRHHQRLYDAGTPEISDAAFDELVKELRRVDPSNPVFGEVGTKPARGRIHTRPMLSLEKCYEDEHLTRWAENTGSSYFLVEPKLDGISCALRYDERGDFLLALTRGDGQVGEDITRNVRLLHSVPKVHGPRNMEVRGELVIRKDAFAARWAEEFANSRNMVAGTMLRKTPNMKALEDVVFVAYDLFPIEGEDTFATTDKVSDLTRFRLTTHEKLWVSKPGTLAEDVKKAMAYAWPFDIDGIVIKVNEAHLRHTLGWTSHHPKWALAFKLQGESGTTTVENVVWQVARNGTITPVLEVQPVQLSGVSVARATLHNMTRFRDLALGRGDTVVMTRRGGVIPQVETVVTRSESRAFYAPLRCPSCEGPVRIEGDFLLCVGPDECPDALTGALEHYAKTIGAMGFGWEICKTLVEAGIETPADLYRLDIDTLPLGLRTGGKLLTEISRTRKMKPEVFLQAIGIDGLGKSTAEKWLEAFAKLELLLDWAWNGQPPPAHLEGVMALTIREGLRERRVLVEDLLTKVQIDEPELFDMPRGGPFVNEVVVFTGEMQSMDREEARGIVTKRGGKAPEGLTLKTTLLVVGGLAGDRQSSKRQKAERYNAKGARIRVISESEFTQLLEMEDVK